MKYRTDLILGEAFCIIFLIFSYVPNSGYSVLNGLHLYFDGVAMKTENGLIRVQVL